MSYHILHLLSHSLKVRIKLDQLHITDMESGTDKSVPLADVAVIVCAARDTEFSASSLRRMAELNVLLLVCNEKFEPCALTLPYYRATSTELLRRQIEWTPDWKRAMWRQIITAKVRNQAANLAHLKRAHTVLEEIAKRCEAGRASSRAETPDTDTARQEPRPTEAKISLANLTASKRAAFLSDTPDACESRAARHYWKHLLPRLSEWQGTDEKRRVPGTREGVNGMLDYGYAILRTAVLRSLAAHGFIAAIGIAHAPKAGSFALADDLMEPLRPWIDRELRQFVQGGKRPMQEWMRQSVSVLQLEVPVNGSRVRLLNAVDVYVQSFADAAMSRMPFPLRIPMLP
ncbi:MAG: CRISPR-associated endonuclease Cas1 [Verrucomicrobia bacterium]|nr:CRISPR-associated endonuclease Cas1 [Verrucomicrobiota bacterium]